jgi:hypothetical protein
MDMASLRRHHLRTRRRRVRIGVARGVRRALIAKVLNKNARGSSISMVRAITWPQEEGARVISLSIDINCLKSIQTWMDKGKTREEAPDAAHHRAVTVCRQQRHHRGGGRQ